ncbi:AMP-binding protein [Streptomyces marokkonensis]|uniref:AMP-binding protein n=1 Tax=Streptomyces marokkonensis TaxID=324855 RepID=A0ABW6PZP1_9ACTN
MPVAPLGSGRQQRGHPLPQVVRNKTSDTLPTKIAEHKTRSSTHSETISYLAAGATVVLMPGFTPQRALSAVQRHRATHMWLVPQMLRFMFQARASHRADLSSC